MGVFERAGDRRQVGRVLLTRAYVWLQAGQLEAAAADALRCLEICVELDHPIGAAMARIVDVWVALDRGDLETARAELAKCERLGRESGYHALLAYCIAADAALCARLGDDHKAARMLGALGADPGQPRDPAGAAGAAVALGGEGARAIGLRLQALREELAGRLGDEMPELLREGARTALEELAAREPAL
jgi:hypothetical protein